MSAPGRLLRQQMRPDTTAQVAERVAHRALCEQAIRERAERWPKLTADNCGAAMEWQERRIAELTREVKP